MLIRWRGWIIGVGWTATVASWCAAAEVELTTDARIARVNEPFVVRITVQNFRQCDSPTFESGPAYSVRQASGAVDFSHEESLNGRSTSVSGRLYAFEVTPLQAGELAIPTISVNVDGEVLQTKPLKITVQPSDADQAFWAEITTDRNRVYVGQRVQLTLAIWVKPAPYGNQVLSKEAMLRFLQGSEETLRPFVPPVRTVERRRKVGAAEQTFYVYEMTTQFAPQQPGPLQFPNIQLGMSYPDRAGRRELRARPRPVDINVLPVPQEGRPANYNGAVGLYDIEVSAAPTSVRVGDPIDLSIAVFGDGPVESLPPPLLSANEPLNADFRVPDEKLAGEVRNARRGYNVTIRARREGATEIPPIEYPYFDPDAERFVIARSKAIPITVTPAAEAAVEPTAAGGATAGPAGKLEPLDGLRDIETSEAALLAGTRPLTAGLVTGVTLAPAGAFALAWATLAVIQRRARDPVRRRRQAALRTARGRLADARLRPPPEMAGAVAAALAGYLADRFDEPPGRFTGRAALDFLRHRNIRVELVDAWAAVLDRCEVAAFAGGTAADADHLIRQALDCVAALEREKL